MENRGEFDLGNWKRHFQGGVGLKWDGIGIVIILPTIFFGGLMAMPGIT